MGKIEVITEKIVKGGVPHRTIIKVKNCYKQSELPMTYLKDYPHMYLVDDEDNYEFILNVNEYTSYYSARDYTEEIFQNDILPAIYLAKKRLSYARKKEKELEEKHNGFETFTI